MLTRAQLGRLNTIIAILNDPDARRFYTPGRLAELRREKEELEYKQEEVRK